LIAKVLRARGDLHLPAEVASSAAQQEAIQLAARVLGLPRSVTSLLDEDSCRRIGAMLDGLSPEARATLLVAEEVAAERRRMLMDRFGPQGGVERSVDGVISRHWKDLRRLDARHLEVACDASITATRVAESASLLSSVRRRASEIGLQLRQYSELTTQLISPGGSRAQFSQVPADLVAAALSHVRLRAHKFADAIGDPGWAAEADAFLTSDALVFQSCSVKVGLAGLSSADGRRVTIFVDAEGDLLTPKSWVRLLAHHIWHCVVRGVIARRAIAVPDAGDGAVAIARTVTPICHSRARVEIDGILEPLEGGLLGESLAGFIVKPGAFCVDASADFGERGRSNWSITITEGPLFLCGGNEFSSAVGLSCGRRGYFAGG
jgi:hypothetical protein